LNAFKGEIALNIEWSTSLLIVPLLLLPLFKNTLCIYIWIFDGSTFRNWGSCRNNAYLIDIKLSYWCRLNFIRFSLRSALHFLLRLTFIHALMTRSLSIWTFIKYVLRLLIRLCRILYLILVRIFKVLCGCTNFWISIKLKRI